MEKSKTHYRRVFKSDHLGQADIEDLVESGVQLIFTIKEVRQEYGVSVAGKKGDHNIAYFKEPIKPMVLNSTNCKVIKGITRSPFVNDWKDVVVELYVDENVKMKGEVVGGVRIKPGIKVLPNLTEGTQAYTNAVAHIRGGKSWDVITSRFNVSPEIKYKIENDANT